MSRWVQHKSGQGEKWETANGVHCAALTICVKAKHGSGYYTLPSDEYIECSPPEEWEDATDEFKVSDGRGNLICKLDGTWLSSKHDRYRFRKVKVEWFHGVPIGEAKAGWAFIVERRKP